MELLTLNLSLPEVQTLRQSLELITIAGKDAKFLASLQIKLEQELSKAEQTSAVNTPRKTK